MKTSASIERSSDEGLPYIAYEGDGVLIAETLIFCHLAHRGMRTFQSALKSPLTHLINHAEYRGLEGKPKLLSHDLTVSRSFIERIIKDGGGTLVPLRGGGLGFRIKVPRRKRNRLKLMVLAMAAYVAAMRHLKLSEAPDGLLLDGLELETEAARNARTRSQNTFDRWGRKRFIRDTGRFYRFPFELWVPKRTSDTRCFDDLVKAVRKAARYVAIELYISIVRSSGCRPGEPQWFTFLHWRSDEHGWFGQDLLLRNKGDAGEAEKDALIERWLVELLIAYIDGERRRLDRHDRDMKAFRALTVVADGDDAVAAARARAELFAAPVLLNSAGRRLTYAVVWHHVDAAKTMLAEDGHAIAATLHYLRHEHVFFEMRRIEKIPDEATREQALEDLCRYMGWTSGLLMIECYDAYESKRRVRETRLKVMDSRAAAEAHRQGPANDNAVPIRVTPALGAMFVAAGYAPTSLAA